MKIGLCLRALQIDGNSTTALLLATTLRDQGHIVTLLSPHPKTPDPGILPGGFHYLHIGQNRWESQVGLARRIARAFSEHDFDVIFLLAGLPIPMLEAALPSIPDRTALIPIVLGDRDHVYEPLQRTSHLWNLVLVISPGLLQQVQVRMPGRAVRLLTHCVNFPAQPDLTSRADHATPLRMISIGRLFGRKNVLLLPQIVAACTRRHVPTTLTVVGDGPERAQLNDACRDAGIADQVEFHSTEARADVFEDLRTHHVLLWTAGSGEGLGLVLLEAQANGCVPVATRLPGISDYAVRDGETGLLSQPGDVEDFSEKIAALTDSAHWRSLSAAGRVYVERFSSRHMGAELAEILAGVTAGAFPLIASRAKFHRPRHKLGAYLPRAIRTALDRIAAKFDELRRHQ